MTRVSLQNQTANGLATTDYYLPLIDFYNETLTAASSRNSAILQQALTSSSLRESKLKKTPKSANLAASLWSSHAFFDPNSGKRRQTQSTDVLRKDNDAIYTEYHSFRSGNWNSRDSNSFNLVKFSLPQLPAQHLRLRDECIGYCVAYHTRHDRILAKNCLKTSPNWMNEIYPYIESRTVTQLMLPGTHNSGTYLHQSTIDKTALQMINKYQVNQDESIFSQLIFGIRHLDLRVGHAKVKGRREKFWVFHDIFRTETSLDDVIAQVKLFLRLTSKEIVVIDFHRFTVGFGDHSSRPAESRTIEGSTRDLHAQVIELLFAELGEYIVPSYLGLNGPLNEYVSANKRLIVCYAARAMLALDNSQLAKLVAFNEQQVRDVDAPAQDIDEVEIIGAKNSNLIFHSKSDKVISNRQTAFASLLFAPTRHLWPNKDSLEGLEVYLNETACRKHFGELNALMVELTPGVFGVLTDRYDGNRRLASLVSRPVSDWIRDRWLHCVNIVSSDYFLANNLVSQSVYANKMRFSSAARRTSVHADESGRDTKCESFRRVGHLLELRLTGNEALDARVRRKASAGEHELATNAPSLVEDVSSGLASFMWSIKRLFSLA